MKEKMTDTYMLGRTVLGELRIGSRKGSDGGGDVVSECLLLENGMAWLWENGAPVLLENALWNKAGVSHVKHGIHEERGV